jgi:uncharacterized membrane protein YtjA (UPF0391 family)
VPDPDGAAVPSEFVPGAPALVPSDPPLAAPGDDAPVDPLELPLAPPEVWARAAVETRTCDNSRPIAMNLIATSDEFTGTIGKCARCSSLTELRISVPVIGTHNVKDLTMTILKWALIFFLISVVAGVFGFTGVSAASADIARVLFYIFGVIFLILLILGFTIFRA